MNPKAARKVAPRRRLGRHPVLLLAGAGILGLALWYTLFGARRAPAGAACRANAACQSGICLPDSDPAEVANFLEFVRAYEQGQRAYPALAGQIGELLEKLPRSSLSLRPRYPGVCTERCALDPDCPPGMFCAEAVWVGAIQGMDLGRVQVCMPAEHPAARLMR